MGETGERDFEKFGKTQVVIEKKDRVGVLFFGRQLSGVGTALAITHRRQGLVASPKP
jgi:hypothetical protein